MCEILWFQQHKMLSVKKKKTPLWINVERRKKEETRKLTFVGNVMLLNNHPTKITDQAIVQHEHALLKIIQSLHRNGRNICIFNLQPPADSKCCSSRCSTVRKSWWNAPGWKQTSSVRPSGLSWPVSNTMRSRCLLSSSSIPCLTGWYSSVQECDGKRDTILFCPWSSEYRV